MKITLLRHGKTPMNATHRFNGQIDEPLSEIGFAEARAAQPNPDLQRVYVTCLMRTQQTAAILFPNAEQIVVDDLQEMYFGECEGMTEDEMEKIIPNYPRWNPYGLIADYPGGENMDGFSQRVCNAMNEISLRHSAEDDHEYAVIHGGTIMAVMHRFDEQKRLLQTWHMPNMCGFTFTIGPGGLYKGGILDVEPYYTLGADTNRIDPKWDRSWNR